ncbi:hypothetical protein GCM10007425_25440 [Lysinibacillus alkalisoli]|uniref:histidine kinase n=1 Tax=Lysinibacillus alkalisoli TaxID=1911548 RepID=A0A917LJ54_9BACI|nr:ATP-binding protein [Lysinibacillus alkalisoli]GGG29734.1 hypothetical protein GCM10007425_25440 [Lysinibacillus alkalisoli]
MKPTGSNMYFTLMLLIGFALAVLCLAVGQLFPIYMHQFNKEDEQYNKRAIEQTITDYTISLSPTQETALLQAVERQEEDEHVTKVAKQIIVTVFIFLLGAFIFIAFIARKIIRKYTDPVDAAIHMAQELSRGNYKARTYEDEYDPKLPLSNTLNMLARNLEELTKIRQVEDERLKTLIENMGSSLMMIGREGNISIVNRVFLERFELQAEHVHGEVFRTIGLPDSVNQFIDHVFLTEMPSRKQIQIKNGTDTRYNEAYGAPVIGDHGSWLGVVIVLHDITDLIRLEQVRKDFVANVSHELRTPITSIKGFSETLLDGAYQDKTMLLSFLEIIHKESNRLQMLVNDLLELSKVEQQNYTITLAPTSLQDVALRGAELTTQHLEEKNMAFAVEIPKDVMVKGDDNRLMQVVTNLIANAITYSPPNTTVTIRIRENEEYGILEIEDEGIGIDEKEIQRVFERFYRVDRARSRNSGGTGLGLAIVKHFVEAHHGKIFVRSEVAKGTAMTVWIPKA